MKYNPDLNLVGTSYLSNEIKKGHGNLMRLMNGNDSKIYKYV
jgi:hypothetical protein